ncbi:CLUMA_CG004659, isoform A [Clunio marinus]|uniref:CLUMA_CG004659, isoform A n=1 Tax=Clunio marinus TaxID=568069 RepID=A0A1J1HTT5_9DIPT|nr:CLUMA_CG004659, isoform A [Clunio marinus]
MSIYFERLPREQCRDERILNRDSDVILYQLISVISVFDLTQQDLFIGKYALAMSMEQVQVQESLKFLRKEGF